ncbi:MAG: universal stress protein [Planctomycetota bacterium]|jgi:nucleotide-binding universal stress UspA family protein
MKFMICYDGSEAAKSALKLAQQNAKGLDVKLEVVNTITREIPLKHAQIKKKEDNLKKEVTDMLGGDDVSYETTVLVTSLTPGEQLIQFAQDEKVSQVYIGIIKKSKVDKLIFGSTAQYVILHAPCPVVTVHK